MYELTPPTLIDRRGMSPRLCDGSTLWGNIVPCRGEQLTLWEIMTLKTKNKFKNFELSINLDVKWIKKCKEWL